MQSRLIVDAQKNRYSAHIKCCVTRIFIGINHGIFSGCCVYFNELKLALSKYYCVTSGFYGLLFLTNKLADRPAGILAAFAFTGFMGYTIGPILNMYVARGMEDLIMLAFAGTAIVFLRVPLMY